MDQRDARLEAVKLAIGSFGAPPSAIEILEKANAITAFVENGTVPEKQAVLTPKLVK